MATTVNSGGDVEDLVVYTGSLHVNVTLPHAAGEDTGPDSPFIQRHRRAAMTLQWLQPLLVVVLGSPHPFNSVDASVFPAISYRHASDPNTGIVSGDLAAHGLQQRREVGARQSVEREPREAAAHGLLDRAAMFARDEIRWMHEGQGQAAVPWVKAMRESSSEAARSFVARAFAGCPCAPVLGTDYRRSPDERAGAFGFEFRSLDLVPPDSVADVLRLVWYAFDASVGLPKSDGVLASPAYNAARSDAFAGFMVAAARGGSAARLTKQYAAALSTVFRLDGGALTGKESAHVALQRVAAILFERHGGGRGEYSRYVDLTEDGEPYQTAPDIPDLNAAAAEYHADGNGARRTPKPARTSRARPAARSARRGSAVAPGRRARASA